MHKILQNHLLYAFVANLKIVAIYALYLESFCDKNLAIWKVFAFCDSAATLGIRRMKLVSGKYKYSLHSLYHLHTYTKQKYTLYILIENTKTLCSKSCRSWVARGKGINCNCRQKLVQMEIQLQPKEIKIRAKSLKKF